jgi:hypothetical protein
MVDTSARKIGWREVGDVAEPGRYLFTFGWLTITSDDLAIWRNYPHAVFTLVAVKPLSEAPDEFRLGAFDLDVVHPARSPR